MHKSSNYNPFISSFRLVIMTLVDVANGRSRHVPYRDSRLTFLLQVKIQIKAHVSIVFSGSLSYLGRIR
jgi:kinesin family protein 15